MKDKFKKFTDKIYTLKALTRYNNKFKIISESVAEHSFFVAIFVLRLHEEYEFNLERALSMGLIHDIPELHLSDITYDVKRDFPKIKDAVLDAEHDVMKNIYPKWSNLFNQLEDELDSVESLIVRLADYISCSQYANAELGLGNSGYMKDVKDESDQRINEVEKKLKKYRRKQDAN
jgi:5'-deoxynucleotidase YfbR-like HD superfamily hydrolase